MPKLEWASKQLPNPTPAQLRLDSLIYPGGFGYPHVLPDNRLVLGDNLELMAALLPEYEGKFDLIYVDPPFYTKRRYPARIGRNEDSRKPKEWLLAEGYRDDWPDFEAYLDMLYPRLIMVFRLLSQSGTLYLHLDWHANAYARLLLDEIFGSERLLNEIIWLYHGPSPIRKAFNRKHDTILLYTKTKNYIFNVDKVRQPYDPTTIKTFASSPKAGFGKVPNLKQGKVPEDWWYFPVVARLHKERTGYPTQKPEGLLERIILASSNPDSLVGDFFCGSGTTAVVADRLGRRFIVSDHIFRSVQTTCFRLVENGSRPFSVEVDRAVGVKQAPNHRKLEAGIQVSWLAASTLAIKLDTITIEDLDYWEVDPNWDGLIFRSAGQVVRRRKEKAASAEIRLPGCKRGKEICVRLFYANKGQQQVVLNV